MGEHAEQMSERDALRALSTVEKSFHEQLTQLPTSSERVSRNTLLATRSKQVSRTTSRTTSRAAHMVALIHF